MIKDYYKHDHAHCWDQGKEPACGIKGVHKVCCLCLMKNHAKNI